MKKIVKEIPARTSVTYQCEICKTKYRSEKKAKECENRVLEEEIFKIGDEVYPIEKRECDGHTYRPKAKIIEISAPKLPDEEYERKWLGSKRLNWHVREYIVEFRRPHDKEKHSALYYAPELQRTEKECLEAIEKSKTEYRKSEKEFKKALGEIFDDAMKKEGFKSIPVGPSPLRRLKKAKNQKKKQPSE